MWLLFVTCLRILELYLRLMGSTHKIEFRLWLMEFYAELIAESLGLIKMYH